MKQVFVALAVLMMGLPVQAERALYAIEPTHTFVTFEANLMGTFTLRGRFERKQGTVSLDRQAHQGHVEVTFDTRSVSTGVPGLDARLKGPEFFDAAQSPNATFVGDHFGFEGERVSTVSGTLALKGKTLPVTLRAERFNCYIDPLFRREVCGGDFDATIARSRWGVGQGSDDGLPDKIHLFIQVEAVRQ